MSQGWVGAFFDYRLTLNSSIGATAEFTMKGNQRKSSNSESISLDDTTLDGCFPTVLHRLAWNV